MSTAWECIIYLCTCFTVTTLVMANHIEDLVMKITEVLQS